MRASTILRLVRKLAEYLSRLRAPALSQRSGSHVVARSKVEGISLFGSISSTIHGELNFAFNNIADFLTGMCDIAIGAATYVDMMDVALQEITM